MRAGNGRGMGEGEGEGRRGKREVSVRERSRRKENPIDLPVHIIYTSHQLHVQEVKWQLKDSIKFHPPSHTSHQDECTTSPAPSLQSE